MIKVANNLQYMLRQQPTIKSSSIGGLIGRQLLLGLPLAALGGAVGQTPLAAGAGAGLGMGLGTAWYVMGLKDRLRAQKQELLKKQQRGEQLTDTDEANLKYLEKA